MSDAQSQSGFQPLEFASSCEAQVECTSEYIGRLMRFLEAFDEPEITIEKLNETLSQDEDDSCRTPPVNSKRAVTSFSADGFVEAIVANVLAIHAKQAKPIKIADAQELLAALSRIVDEDEGSSASELQLEFTLTLLLHLSKTETAKSRAATSHVRWFIGKVIRKYFFDAETYELNLPPVYRHLDPFIAEFWADENSRLKNNLALFFLNMPLPDSLPKTKWNLTNIVACLAEMQVKCCSLPRKIGGFVWLSGIAINTRLNVPCGAGVNSDTLQRNHYLRVFVHETAHFLIRQLCSEDHDLNFSTPPRKMNFQFSDVATAKPESDELLQEFGFQSEMQLFGGVYDWLEIAKPLEAPTLCSIGAKIFEKLISTDLAPSMERLVSQHAADDFVLTRGGALLNMDSEVEYLRSSCVNLPLKKIKELVGTFGVLLLSSAKRTGLGI